MPRLKVKLDETNDFYGLVADSVGNLKRKAKQKFHLGCPPESLVVKLEDGTIVDDEEYFECIEPDTRCVISEPGRRRTGAIDHRGDNPFAVDSVDSSIACSASAAGVASIACSASAASGDEEVIDIHRLLSRLQKDITNIAQFTEEQLQVVVSGNVQEIQTRLQLSTEEIEGLQEACHIHLVERQKTTDALELLKLYQKHMPDEDISASTSSSLPHKRAKRMTTAE